MEELKSLQRRAKAEILKTETLRIEDESSKVTTSRAQRRREKKKRKERRRERDAETIV